MLWCVCSDLTVGNALLCFRTLTPLWHRRIVTVTVDYGCWLSPSGQLLRKVLPILVRSRSLNITGLGMVTHIGGTAFRCGSIHLACIHAGALCINIYIYIEYFGCLNNSWTSKQLWIKLNQSKRTFDWLLSVTNEPFKYVHPKVMWFSNNKISILNTHTIYELLYIAYI